ncbi:MAG: 4,5-dihydroxyphthalate decarboxylase [Pseudomonadota bacterium]
MNRLTLSLAVGDYDHVRDLLSGRVRAEGIELLPVNLPVEEIFYRFTKFREWDVSEMAFGKYVSLASQDEGGLMAIPVFPSRMFRQSSFYVRADSDIAQPEQLRGKRIGVPEWAQTASIYSRGYLTHTAGIALTDIEWFQAGVNEAGRAEKVALRLPPGVSLTPVPGRSLNDMLLAGDIDMLMSARPPKAFADGSGQVKRMFADPAEAERQYFQQTGIFPIMHVIAMRRDTFERNPWIAMNLLKAFTEAKDRSLARALDITCSHSPLPWGQDAMQHAQSLFGNDVWPYGIDANRTTIQAFIDFAFEQGVCHRRLTVEELFPKQVQSTFKV